jgi:hypothetical protein
MESRPGACQPLISVVRVVGKSIYLAGLKSSRERPTTSELEHLDGRCRNDTQSRQLLGVGG